MTKEQHIEFLINSDWGPSESTNPRKIRRDFFEALKREGYIIRKSAPISRVRSGYMCKTDFDFELGIVDGGVLIYNSIEDLVRCRSCVNPDNICEVEVVEDEIIDNGYNNDEADHCGITKVSVINYD